VTLRSRLLLALLAFALLPTLLLGVFAVVQLDRAIARWYRPGVSRALDSALEVTKSAATRLDGTALAQADAWAARWPATPPAGAEREGWRAALRGAGMDFLQLYRHEGTAWRRVDQLVPTGVLLPQGPDLGSELPGTLDVATVLHSDRGALAGVARTRSGDALVAGVWVPPDFFSRLESVGQGVTYYRRLGLTAELQRRVILLLVALLALALVLLAVLFSARLAHQMAQPLADLSSALRSVDSGGAEVRLTPTGARELRSLAESFNSMTDRLAGARVALQQAEREAAWRDVARKLAHEFKNTLTPLRLSLQLLECQIEVAPAEARPDMARNLKAALREVDSLNRLAGQFSQYARLPEPSFEPLDVVEAVQSAAELVPEGRVRIDAPAGGIGSVSADRVLLARALHNLLLNAMEASPPEAPIEVRVRDQDGSVRLDVLDRGTGLPQDLRDRLFEPYVSTKKRGSGLGLSLVRDVARQHGGAVTLEDRPGGGACASLLLPRQATGVRA
jgi:nitrogen fixation/metabolism regulation signal transduction histidine kinase